MTIPIFRARRGAKGTALGSAIVWMGGAMVLGIAAQVVGLGEGFETGRPRAGLLVYLSTLAVLAASTTVLNARRPGSGAWAILMGVLVLVFLLPWLEGRGLMRSPEGWERLRLNPPWTIFFALVAVTGITNYLPTRYGWAAAWVGLAIGLAYLGLTRTDWPLHRRGLVWSASPWALGVGLWTAEVIASRRRSEPPGLGRLWLFFRDHWGVVWALRVQERFNRTAEAAHWPIRLTWQGVAAASEAEGSSPQPIPLEATATLKTLLRRFADDTRLDEESGSDRPIR